MKMQDACEQAYRNGYLNGYKKGIEDSEAYLNGYKNGLEEADKRNKPMKPIESSMMYLCPCCLSLVVLTDFETDITCNFCKDCGQAIDWSE